MEIAANHNKPEGRSPRRIVALVARGVSDTCRTWLLWNWWLDQEHDPIERQAPPTTEKRKWKSGWINQSAMSDISYKCAKFMCVRPTLHHPQMSVRHWIKVSDNCGFNIKSHVMNETFTKERRLTWWKMGRSRESSMIVGKYDEKKIFLQNHNYWYQSMQNIKGFRLIPHIAYFNYFSNILRAILILARSSEAVTCLDLTL